MTINDYTPWRTRAGIGILLLAVTAACSGIGWIFGLEPETVLGIAALVYISVFLVRHVRTANARRADRDL